MQQLGARRAPPDDGFDFEGAGEEARHWLDQAYGTSLNLGGRMGTVSHRRIDRHGVAFDHLRIGSSVTFDADAMPVLVVVDVLRGEIEYTHGATTDRGRAGDTVLAAGWDQPFAGSGNGYDVRNTSITADVLTAAIHDVDPEMSRHDLTFERFVPRSQVAAAQWRATVDELSAWFPDSADPVAYGEASRLLGHTLLHTFDNNVVGDAAARESARDRRDATQSTVRRAQEVIAARAHEDLSLADIARECRVTPRALQYAFRRHLGCTPLAYVKQVRLDLVHQALCDGTALTVSDAASRYGFFNPGRFASDYRRVFGENPRQTLARLLS
ncbi:helix-turn-helix transcriptional regulator [Nocardioides xinjiangensis]|uniref:helix-turn-helix transcriptional regulator n=1 Tax=Nocardioides xinjiangensis TaxID=2817376 RepID=UPI001B31581B|nr:MULTISPECIES: helix-turn-helix transcriptional regulator [unclassified Nocardioides]